jgi:hypothetical protein
LYVVPAKNGSGAELADAERKKLASLHTQWPGVSAETQGTDIHIVIPKKFRVGHEAHFAQVANKFFTYMASPKSMPSWERPNMLVKYFLSTKGVEMGQKAK